MDARELKVALAQFTGSDHLYRHNLMRSICYTDGVAFLAEEAGAYWLIDKIAAMQLDWRVKSEEFQAWKLVVEDSKAKLTCDDGNGTIVWKEQITFTDFPLPEITLWFENKVICLPSER